MSLDHCTENFKLFPIDFILCFLQLTLMYFTEISITGVNTIRKKSSINIRIHLYQKTNNWDFFLNQQTLLLVCASNRLLPAVSDVKIKQRPEIPTTGSRLSWKIRLKCFDPNKETGCPFPATFMGTEHAGVEVSGLAYWPRLLVGYDGWLFFIPLSDKEQPPTCFQQS